MKKTLLICLAALASSASGIERITLDGEKYREFATAKDIPIADTLYQHQKYELAYQIYEKLSINGDKYSQYVISDMYLNGHGVEKDTLKAYAWAYVAKEGGDKQLEDYFQSLENSLTADQKQQAEPIKKDIYEKYSNLAIASDLSKWLYHSLPTCTGSRVRGSTAGCSKEPPSCHSVDFNHKENQVSVNVIYHGDQCYKNKGYNRFQHVNRMKNTMNNVNEYIQAKTKVTSKRVN